MLTPQEVSTHAFTKAVMGGYNMAMVDEFLDELTDDYTARDKESAALKAKRKVLVEKVEDYRATEDSMRATLLTAQKMADSIVREAEAKRDEIMNQAETQAQEKIAQLRREIGESEDRRNKVVNIHATTQLKVVLVKPERFENASEIADHLKDKRTVVLNLESTNKDVARRLIDFLSGVAYAGEGKIKKIAANTYIITPYPVDIEGDLIDELESSGMYL